MNIKGPLKNNPQPGLEITMNRRDYIESGNHYWKNEVHSVIGFIFSIN